jgi:hypothetical protein
VKRFMIVICSLVESDHGNYVNAARICLVRWLKYCVLGVWSLLVRSMLRIRLDPTSDKVYFVYAQLFARFVPHGVLARGPPKQLSRTSHEGHYTSSDPASLDTPYHFSPRKGRYS